MRVPPKECPFCRNYKKAYFKVSKDNDRLKEIIKDLKEMLIIMERTINEDEE